MASRVFSPAMRALSSPSAVLRTSRSFQTSSQRLADAVPIPVRKPVGAFRGGLFGFLLGSTSAGIGTYYYVLEEYKVSNESQRKRAHYGYFTQFFTPYLWMLSFANSYGARLLTEDIYSLQAAVQRVHGYVQTLEQKLDEQERKKK